MLATVKKINVKFCLSRPPVVFYTVAEMRVLAKNIQVERGSVLLFYRSLYMFAMAICRMQCPNRTITRFRATMFSFFNHTFPRKTLFLLYIGIYFQFNPSATYSTYDYDDGVIALCALPL